jgi:hypothetical protein
MRHNRIADAYFWRATEVFADLCLVASAADGTAVADAHAVRFVSGDAGREQLPGGRVGTGRRVGVYRRTT